MHRTGDGVLHVAWQRETAPLSDDLLHTSITPAGNVGNAQAIVTGWNQIGDAALVGSGGGIRLFFSGIRTTNPTEPLFGLNTATAPAAGAPWSLEPASIAVNDYAYGRTPAATIAADGTPLQTWYAGSIVVVHRGLNPGTPDYLYPPDSSGLCCSFRPNIVTDPSTGRVFVSWCTFDKATKGVYAQQVDPASGAPAGLPSRLPGSTTTYQGVEYGTCNLESGATRNPMAARSTGGIYVGGAAGYPTLTRLLVWRLTPDGSLAATMAVASSKRDHRTLTLAGDPGGRIWVAWTENVGAQPVVYARRSNRAGTAFGAVVHTSPPRGSLQADALDLAAQNQRVDVLGRFSSATGVGLWHTQLFPGLTLKATAKRSGKTVSVTARVTDAGDPVAGAKVTVGGSSATTNASGTATVSLRTKAGSVGVKASAAGYVSARTRARVS